MARRHRSVTVGPVIEPEKVSRYQRLVPVGAPPALMAPRINEGLVPISRQTFDTAWNDDYGKRESLPLNPSNVYVAYQVRDVHDGQATRFRRSGNRGVPKLPLGNASGRGVYVISDLSGRRRVRLGVAIPYYLQVPEEG